MAIELSYAMQQRIAAGDVARQDVVTATEQAFFHVRRLGLRSADELRASVNETRQRSAELLALLDASPCLVDVGAHHRETGDTLIHSYASCLFPPRCVLQALLQAGAQLNAINPLTGDTPLHKASLGLLHQLTTDFMHHPLPVRHYADVQMEELTWRMPVCNRHDQAGRRRLYSAAELLLGFGADTTLTNSQGHRALDTIAAETSDAANYVHHYVKAGHDAYRLLLADGFHQASPHLLLQCANVGRLADALHHPQWPHDYATTLQRLEPMAPCLSGALLAEQALRDDRLWPQSTITQRLKPEKLDFPARQKGQGS